MVFKAIFTKPVHCAVGLVSASTAFVCLLAACSKPSNSQDVIITSNVGRPQGPSLVPTASPTPVIPLDEKKAMLQLRENCYGCHGMGKDKSSFWQTPPEFEHPTEAELGVLKAEARAQGKPEPTIKDFETVLSDKSSLEKMLTRMETDQFSVEVFQAIENKILSQDGKISAAVAIPKPMRPSMDDSTRARFVSLMDQLMSPPTGPTSTAAPSASAAVKPLTLAEAKSWCVGCHSPGGSAANSWNKANGSEQDWKSFAASAKESVSAKRMPPSKLNSSDRDLWLRMLAFFQRRMPSVVLEARSKYHGNKIELGVPVDVQYKCQTTRSGREFINELTLNALNRPPTAAELALVPNDQAPASADTRRRLVNRLNNEWKIEFINNGIKKFADRISSADKTRSSALLTDQGLKNDIANEFFEKIKATIAAGKSYKEALVSNKVFVTKRTGPFYGPTCALATASLAEGQYVECDLKADSSPRSSFFTTLAFLFPRSSSMFQENNNYGRVAGMNEVIRGEPLQANTAGETGDTVNPLPGCLKSKDWRVMLQGDTFAPRGTMTVPASGNFCQGCHIRRNLAAGSVVFRPFGPVGEILNIDDIQTLIADQNVNVPLKEHESILVTLVHDATDPSKWANLPPAPGNEPPIRQEIGMNYFRELLKLGKDSNEEAACVFDPVTRKEVPVLTVAEMLDVLIADEMVLPRGLARIVPRALSNRNSTNPEVIEAMTESWKVNSGQIIPLIQSYFLTDTYACKVESGGEQ